MVTKVRFNQVRYDELPPRRLRTEAQMACPCDYVIAFPIVERDGFDRQRVVRECADCGFTEVGRLVRIATQPDSDH